MTTAALSASVAFAIGVWLTVAVMTMSTRRPTTTEILGAVPAGVTERQARALRAEIHADLQLPPPEDDHTEDLRPNSPRKRTAPDG